LTAGCDPARIARCLLRHGDRSLELLPATERLGSEARLLRLSRASHDEAALAAGLTNPASRGCGLGTGRGTRRHTPLSGRVPPIQRIHGLSIGALRVRVVAQPARLTTPMIRG